ncbi:MAG TPA: P27 family phage terminase small subunit [Nitrospira sp.]|nr:P27 family phage terminase small subunit [Nitrospira sp.]
MGKRGPTGRPNHLKALEGVEESRINRDEPIPSVGAVLCPVELNDAARAVWNRLAPDLIQKKVLTCWDADEFANGCRIQALLNEALDTAESCDLVIPGSNDNLVMHPAIRAVTALEATLRSVWSRFGLTPGDRAALKVDDGGDSSGDEALIV